MKYTKLLSKIFDNRSNNNGQVAIALVAGLAAGAVLSILFAPDSGANVRKGIADQARGLGNGIKDGYGRLRDRVIGQQELEEPIAAEVPHFTHKVTKRPKSAIKDIIHDAHGQHTEQPLS
ncbi:MAG: YtxH domain-containing protein [Pedobacter sp.]|nr:YtxH domain-containing protein [Pedobacter sp.]MDQ8053489.1 YtxH domain-containing protein [Pedobacter sp.]